MEHSTSLAWQVAALFAVCVTLVLSSGKRAFKVLSRNDDSPSLSKTPWNVDCAFVLFLLYAVLFPVLAHTIVSNYDINLKFNNSSPTQSESNVFPSNDHSEEPRNDSNKKSIATQHPMARLLIRAYGTPQYNVVVLIFFLAVVCAAPLTEEFIFRVVMQGAFEKAFLSYDEQEVGKTNSNYPQPSKWKTTLVIGIPAIIFALLHMGTPETSKTPIPCEVLFKTTISSLASNLVALLFSVIILRKFFEARFRNIGCDYPCFYGASNLLESLSNVVQDFYRGFVLYLSAAPIILGVNVLAQKIFPNAIIAPIPIFLFAIWNGYIYYRTHKYVICIGSHIALNFISFIFLLLNVRAHTFSVF